MTRILKQKINFTKSKDADNADVVMIDANPCVTSPLDQKVAGIQEITDTRVEVPKKCKVLIVDATSADVDEYGKTLRSTEKFQRLT